MRLLKGLIIQSGRVSHSPSWMAGQKISSSYEEKSRPTARVLLRLLVVKSARQCDWSFCRLFSALAAGAILLKQAADVLYFHMCQLVLLFSENGVEENVCQLRNNPLTF